MTTSNGKVSSLKWKILFWLVSVLFAVGLPLLQHSFKLWPGESAIQLLYAVVSAIVVVAIYLWGVGNWSRFEPSRDEAADSAQKSTEERSR